MVYNPEKFWDRRAKNPDLVGGGRRKNVQKQLNSEFGVLLQWYDFYLPNEVLDVGCAEGRILQCFREKGFGLDVTMCDISDEYRKRCFKETGILPDRCDGRILPYPNESFGLVVSDNVLLHVSPDLIDKVWIEHVRVSRKYLYVATNTKNYINVEGHFCHDYFHLFEESRLSIKEEMRFGKQRVNWWLEKKIGSS